jgi:hypothetical protein
MLSICICALIRRRLDHKAIERIAKAHQRRRILLRMTAGFTTAVLSGSRRRASC